MICQKCNKESRVILQTGENEYECAACWSDVNLRAKEVNEVAQRKAANKTAKSIKKNVKKEKR